MSQEESVGVMCCGMYAPSVSQDRLQRGSCPGAMQGASKELSPSAPVTILLPKQERA